MNVLETILQKGTGKGSQYWMDWIGNTILSYTDDKRTTQSNLWLHDLADEVFAEVKERFDLIQVDENIITSTLASLILTLWSCRVRRAKAYDPRRPLDARKTMMEGLLQYHASLLECMVDESKDAEYFPAQEWQPPCSVKE